MDFSVHLWRCSAVTHTGIFIKHIRSPFALAIIPLEGLWKGKIFLLHHSKMKSWTEMLFCLNKLIWNQAWTAYKKHSSSSHFCTVHFPACEFYIAQVCRKQHGKCSTPSKPKMLYIDGSDTIWKSWMLLGRGDYMNWCIH